MIFATIGSRRAGGDGTDTPFLNHNIFVGMRQWRLSLALLSGVAGEHGLGISDA